MYRSALCLTFCVFLSISAAAQWTSSDPSNSNQDAVAISRTGNVAIGGTYAADKLDVNGNARLVGAFRQFTLGNGQGLRDPGGPDLDLFDAAPGGNLRFFTGGAAMLERMRIDSAGNVGIGTTGPQKKLHIVGSDGVVATFPTAALGSRDILLLENNNNVNLALVAGGTANSSTIRFVRSGAAAMNGGILYAHSTDALALWTAGVEQVRIDNLGNVGIGTTAPAAGLHVFGPGQASTTPSLVPNTAAQHGASLFLQDSNATATSGGMLVFGASQGHFAAIKGLLSDGSSNTLGHLGFYVRYLPQDTNLVERMRITREGKVGISNSNPAEMLDVTGNVHATGNISADGTIFAKYQDVAEWVPATDNVGPGTVVVIARGVTNVVAASSEAYDTRVAGVVSAQPGVVLGQASDSKALIATTGRVKVKVDATHAAIHEGDILVSSAVAGTAMKSEPIDIGGIKIHRPGTVIGKALESLESGTGEILVLLTLQ